MPILIALLAGSLFLSRARLSAVRSADALATETRRADDADARAADSAGVTAAVDSYATRAAALQPIILHSKDTVTTYAQTPAGRAACLGADRALGIDALDATLNPPAAANGSAGAVPADPSAPAAGR